MWNGYGVCSNLASSGEPTLLHMTTLTTELDCAVRLLLVRLGSVWWLRRWPCDQRVLEGSNPDLRTFGYKPGQLVDTRTCLCHHAVQFGTGVSIEG